MAKYTELLAEYLENGGQLPAVFEDIQGFKDLFIGEYIDKEIGFETDNLFSIKLEARAALVIPPYKQRISDLEAARENLSNPTKTRIKTGNITRDYGVQESAQNNIVAERNSATAEQPFNVTETTPSAYVNPSSVSTDKGHTDKVEVTSKAHQDKETYNEVKETEEGFTSSEAEALFKSLESNIFIIKRQLLKEFSSLFMKVY